MSFNYTYNSLFEIFIYHDYFLDDGKKKFKSMDPDNRAKQLMDYHLSDFFEITPTFKTANILKNNRLRFVIDNDRIRIVASTVLDKKSEPLISIGDDEELYFIIRLKDAYFMNYTQLEFNSDRIYLFTNNANTAGVPFLPLYPELGGGEEPHDLDQIITDQYMATEAASKTLIEQISANEQAGVFGMFVIKMKSTIRIYSIMDGTFIVDPAKKFMLRFENISRFWKYKSRTPSAAYLTKEPFPLVKNGFIEINPEHDLEPKPESIIPNMYFPNPNVSSQEREGIDDDSPIYSVIFI